MMKSWTVFSVLALASAFGTGCGSPDVAATDPDAGATFGNTIVLDPPVLLDSGAGACTEAHTVCLRVKMPDSIPGPPTHLAVGYFRTVPVKAPALARAVLQSPPLVAGQEFRLMINDGNLMADLFPVVLVYMPGGGDVVAVDNLDYTAEATQTAHFSGVPINVAELLQLIYGI